MCVYGCWDMLAGNRCEGERKTRKKTEPPGSSGNLHTPSFMVTKQEAVLSQHTPYVSPPLMLPKLNFKLTSKKTQHRTDAEVSFKTLNSPHLFKFVPRLRAGPPAWARQITSVAPPRQRGPSLPARLASPQTYQFVPSYLPTEPAGTTERARGADLHDLGRDKDV